MIYLDANSTSRILPEVFETMKPYLTDRFYNPSSPYSAGREVAKEIEDAREFFAKSINAETPEEIYFVSCGSEANNWALKSWKRGYVNIITDTIEHHSVLNAVNDTTAFAVMRCGIDKFSGKINMANLVDHILYCRKGYINRTPPKNILISTMWVNNEIGTIQPIEEIGNISNKYNTYFHVDGVQAYGKIPIDVQANRIDMLSVSSHKIGAPRGSGFLYIRKGTPLKSFINGGQQENHMRAGTENVAGIIAFKKAAEIAMDNMDANYKKLKNIHDTFTKRLEIINGIRIINKNMPHYPNVLSVYCGVPAERMVAFLDQYGIYVSSGSACDSHSGRSSHVLKAIGLMDNEANSTIRISFGPDLTAEDIDYTVRVIETGIDFLSK